jgi:sulfite exporter TauE/SafE
MTETLLALSLTAISISSIHTMSGPDHYLPFIVLSRSRKWSTFKTYVLTIICGLGHILSSVILGLIAVVLGWQMNKISWFQDLRGNISGWALLIFGLAYLIYGLWQAFKNKLHKHFDVYGEDVYVFEHKHGEIVMPNKRVKVTPLVLFAIFVMGPSEPLIPLLFFSGTHRSITEITVLVSVFAISTVITMLIMVIMGRYGYNIIKTEMMERYSNAIGGLAITICASGMVFWGW